MSQELKRPIDSNALKSQITTIQNGISYAEKYDSGKLDWSLVDFEALEPLVKVLEFGARKYSRDGWRPGLPVTRIINSLLRHTFALLSGEDIDPESGLPHIGHMQANVMFLGDFLKKPELDDRLKTKSCLNIQD